MENNIGVGLIVGLTLASSIYVWSNEKFSKAQKAILLVLLIFPPAQWVGILVVLAYNGYKENNTTEKITERKVEQVKVNLDSSISNLKDLKDKGILTDEEYKTKVAKINADKEEQNIKNSLEYKQLKSLLDSGILTKEEFESKLILLKNKPKVKIKDFRIVDGFSEGLALAINSELDYGFVDNEGNIIIPFKFEHAENFKEGIAKVRYNGEFKNINKKGEFIK
ncbi:MAG: SHOCT domain-containing protein [Flavobacterium sp.]|nr:SHOCT domain-containing protein [Flavobacterium sp.]